MYLGKIVELGNTEDVFNHPAHPYTKALLSMPQIKRDGSEADFERFGAPPLNPPPGCSFHPRCFAQVGKICQLQPPSLAPVADSHWAACHRGQV